MGEVAPSKIEVQELLVGGISVQVVATDFTSNVSMLTCTLCPDISAAIAQTHNISCSSLGLGSNRATLLLRAQSLPAGYFTCMAQDAEGAEALSATQVVIISATTTLVPTTAFTSTEDPDETTDASMNSATTTLVLTTTLTSTEDPDETTDASVKTALCSIGITIVIFTTSLNFFW